MKKVMETLTLKGVFIGFPNELKCLEPIKGLGHLIQPKAGPNRLINLIRPIN